MNQKAAVVHRLACGQVWGGIKNSDQEIETSGLRASLYSHSISGGKGGDIYYFSVCQGDMLTRVAVADVVGHGEAVSKVSQCIYKTMLKFMNNAESNSLLTEWNRSMTSENIDVMTTAVVGGVYASNRKLHYSYAGHHPILIRRSESKTWEPIHLEAGSGSNLPLGIVKDMTYEQNDNIVNPGDKIFLYTDGVIEARDSDGKMFGEDRLMSVLDEASKGCCTSIKSAVLEAVRYFTNDRLDHDDMTLMAIEF